MIGKFEKSGKKVGEENSSGKESSVKRKGEIAPGKSYLCQATEAKFFPYFRFACWAINENLNLTQRTLNQYML